MCQARRDGMLLCDRDWDGPALILNHEEQHVVGSIPVTELTMSGVAAPAARDQWPSNGF